MADDRLSIARSTAVEAGLDHALPSRVVASWQRSDDYGVPLDVVDPVFVGAYDDDSLFVRCGSAVLTDLHETLVDEPVSLMLTDGDGLVLNRFSPDPSLLATLDDVHLAPGFTFSERYVGTNGLGLALADRTPSLVRAEEHYSLVLRGYTCAAAPVINPVTGALEGCVNLTTWSRSGSALLLALAQSAAASTASMMLARSQGRTPRQQPLGEVRRVETARLEPGAGSLVCPSPLWADALERARRALGEDLLAAAVGEEGSGRATLLAQALRRLHPRARILSTEVPAAGEVEHWLESWSPELAKPDTAVVVRGVDRLPTWAAQRLRDLAADARRQRHDAAPTASRPVPPLLVTADRFDALPEPLRAAVVSVVSVAPLRDRPEDVVPLADHVARHARGRDVTFSAAATRALQDHGWPGNVGELVAVVRAAAVQSDVVEPRHLPAEVLSGSGHRLTRLETVERDEIVRALTRPGTTVTQAAQSLGMSRATMYRKIAQYRVRLPAG